MDIQEKQARWALEKPLFEAEFIHSHLLPFFNFNENTGDYEIKSEYENDEDRALSFNVLNTGWAMWLRAKRDAKAQTVQEGFVLVPKEPTKEYKDVISQYLDELWMGEWGCDWDGFICVNSIDPNHVWKIVTNTKAMIEAQVKILKEVS
ncbi:hypothetical protein [Acinetobacter cumulans]|uniref:hypothetical protein n=1 Tax=Acinetobacter cumulans TaxID=2136182 RepID=UPI001C090000|nr:hypothetical protein [Acinetobacter cumulans]